MKLEKQVVSLELAKKLKEFGFKQESFFHWIFIEDRITGSPSYWKINPGINSQDGNYSAYTVAELGEILSIWQKSQSQHYFKTVFNGTNWDGYLICIESGHDGLAIENCDTEADARAKILIFLYENKTI